MLYKYKRSGPAATWAILRDALQMFICSARSLRHERTMSFNCTSRLVVTLNIVTYQFTIISHFNEHITRTVIDYIWIKPNHSRYYRSYTNMENVITLFLNIITLFDGHWLYNYCYLLSILPELCLSILFYSTN